MSNWIEDRAAKYREFFNLSNDAPIVPNGALDFESNSTITENLKRFNIEWHFVPATNAVPFDDAYIAKLYPTSHRLKHRLSSGERSVKHQLIKGHCRQQGTVIGVETTQKPVYLPRNRQFYGTAFGHDPSADPLAEYLGLAGITTGTRYEQNYPTLRRLFNFLNEDWQTRKMLPVGYRVTVCPPGIFNLVGTVFHPEWSETPSLELGFYRDERGNASCFAVGANAPRDFSYIDVVEGEEWSLTGFRLALLPDETRYDANCDAEGKK
jgi:hypothetical protein